MNSKAKFPSFMTNVNPNNANKTKPDVIFHWSQNTKNFNDFYS